MALIIFLSGALIFSLILFFVTASSFVGFVMTRVPYVLTSRADILELVQKVPITKDDVFIDLGCGSGKVLFAVEKASGAKVKGFELALWAYLWGRIKTVFKKSGADIRLGNFFHQNLSEATVIYCYLYPPLMRGVGQKVIDDCRQGTKVVSRDFPIPNLQQIGSWKSVTGHDIYLYQR